MFSYLTWKGIFRPLPSCSSCRGKGTDPSRVEAFIFEPCTCSIRSGPESALGVYMDAWGTKFTHTTELYTYSVNNVISGDKRSNIKM